MKAMTCREITERLGDHHRDEIDAAAQQGVDAHLMTCDHCLRYAADYAVTVRSVQMSACG
jgi:hypothetical protein